MKYNITKWQIELERCLLQYDIKELEKFLDSHRDVYGDKNVDMFLNNSDFQNEIILNKMIVNCKSLPKELKDRAEKWLLDNGFKPYIVL